MYSIMLLLRTKKVSSLLISALPLLIGLQGCSSPEIPIHYYSLNTIESNTLSDKESATELTLEAKKQLVIRHIEMADFLKTGSLVMQVDAHQIQLSNQHRWADKLPRAISISLVRLMSNNHQGIKVAAKRTKLTTDEKNYTIDVFFEQFTLSTNNETVISGSYMIQSNNNQTRRYFDIRQPLEEDGYNHAIERFQHSLNSLSAQILNEVAQ